MTLHQLAFLIHLGSLAAAGCAVLYADKVGFGWMRGTIETISPRTLKVLHDTVSLALALIIASGLYLFWPERAYLLGQPLFFVKMFFVAALVINSLLIDALMHVAARLPYASLTRRHKNALVISGALSMLCWLGAGITALLLFGI